MSATGNITGRVHKLNPARAEIKARHETRKALMRSALRDRGTEPMINIEELTAVVMQTLREALR